MHLNRRDQTDRTVSVAQGFLFRSECGTISAEAMGKRRGPATPIVVPRKPSPLVSSSSAGFELQKEVERLKEQLTDKQETIEAQVKYIEKLTLSLEQKSAQNEEIIQHYYRQYKELEQSRQELKLLQHEYTQMSSVYRISKTELQTKLQEATERINQLLEEKENRNSNNENKMNNNNENNNNNVRRKPPSTQVKRSKRRKSRRASADLSSCSTRIIGEQQEDDASTSRRDERFRPIMEEACTSNSQNAPAPADPTGSSVQQEQRPSQSGRPLRRAAGAVVSYKEPPLNTKMRRPF